MERFTIRFTYPSGEASFYKNLGGDWTNSLSVTFKKGPIRFLYCKLSQLITAQYFLSVQGSAGRKSCVQSQAGAENGL